ncbi:MAG: hypothetical protein GY947_04615 [Rhodobacteraceae bacterium]|nr:hypothetical protein [Paracoccaceae bacterium]
MKLNLKVLGTALVVLAQPAFAQESCFLRNYTDSHLAKNHNQTVRMISIAFEGAARAAVDAGGTAGVNVRFRESNRGYQAFMLCDPSGNPLWCGVECDGGSATIKWRSKDQILLTTKGFYVDSDCGEGDMREVKDLGVASTTYRLDRVAVDQCEPMRPMQ